MDVNLLTIIYIRLFHLGPDGTASNNKHTDIDDKKPTRILLII